MGDDTYGQCGMDNEKRSTFPPFNERRVSYPIRVVSVLLFSLTSETSKKSWQVGTTA